MEQAWRRSGYAGDHYPYVERPSMRIGIIGTGMIGGSLAGLWVQHGHEVHLANSRGPQSLTSLTDQLGERAIAATVDEAARDSEVIVVSIPFGRLSQLPREPFADRIVIDTCNYNPRRDGHFPELASGQTTSTEVLAAHLKGAQVVKAFNTIYFQTLRQDGRPGVPEDERLAIPIAGDDPGPKAIVEELIREIGFAPVDFGTLTQSYRQQPGSPVFNHPLNRAQALRYLDSAN
jgi:8-hydroxy-5-deazaflavin:NADPH oxidoreductase